MLLALRQEHASPWRLGAGVGVGVLIGCSPFLGFQLVLAVALALLLRLNKVAVLLGVQVSAPPVTPLILFANVQLGARILHGHWLPLSLHAVRQTPAATLVRDLLVDFALGGLLLGCILGAVLGVATALVAERWRLGPADPSALPRDAAREELLLRLRELPRRWRSYGYWKLRLDPVYELARREIPEGGRWLDLGGGIGLLAGLGALAHPGLDVQLVEWDARKAELARRLLAGLQVHVETGDARAATLGQPEVITLLDVLHYSPLLEQQRWLDRCVAALAPGGVLLVRELDPGSKGVWAPRLERVAVRLGWNAASSVHVWPPSAIAEQLKAHGMLVTVRPCGRGLFEANGLVVARKPLQDEAHRGN
jgi:uncharacterized protein (DUF2062 family)